MFIFILIIASRGALALGTHSGTIISNSASINAANIEEPANSNTLGATVMSVYGIATNTEPADSGTTTGGFVYYKIKITNKANNSDTIRITTGAQSFSANAGTTTNWSVEVDDADPYVAGLTWNNSGTAKAAQTGDYATMLLGPGAQATFTVKVTAASNAGNGATMSVPLTLQTTSAPAGKYTGFNGASYGGIALAVRTAGAAPGKLTTSIQGAILNLVKTAAVQSPSQYQALGGSAAAPVPGSKITCTITYSNSGAANAANVSIIDVIPSGATYLPGSITTSLFGAQTDAADADKCDFNITNAGAITCNVGAVNGGAGGLTIQYSVTIN